jgi:predicted acyl esterase
MNDEPTVAAAVPKRKEIYGGDAWPGKPRMVTYGSNDSELLEGREGEPSTMDYVADPAGFEGQETGNATMVAKPETEERILVGLPKLELHASVVGERTDLIANILDRNPAGEERRISLCAMTPLLRGALDTPMPIVPGEVMKLEPFCWPMGHKLRKGHSLVLRVASSDGEFVPLGASGYVSVHVGADATKLSIPVVDGAKLTADTFPVGPKPGGDTGD